MISAAGSLAVWRKRAFGRVKRLGKEAGRTGIADDEVREAETLVQPQRPAIALLDFQRELATSALPSAMLRGGKKSPADAFAPPFRKHRQVVHVQERASPESREPKEAHRDTDRAPLLDGKKHQRGGMILQSRDETFTHIWAEGLPAPHRIDGVRVQDMEEPCALFRIFEVRVYDVNVHFGQTCFSRFNI